MAAGMLCAGEVQGVLVDCSQFSLACIRCSERCPWCAPALDMPLGRAHGILIHMLRPDRRCSRWCCSCLAAYTNGLGTAKQHQLQHCCRAVSCCTGSAMTACSSKTQLAGFCLAGLHWEWLPLMPVCRLLHRLRQARTTSTAASVNIDRPDAFCGR